MGLGTEGVPPNENKEGPASLGFEGVSFVDPPKEEREEEGAVLDDESAGDAKFLNTFNVSFAGDSV